MAPEDRIGPVMCIRWRIIHTSVIGMRTNIEIDDELLSQAMTAAGLSTKRATVEEGLRLLVRVREQVKALAELKGLGWEGDLDEMRQGRRHVSHDSRR